MIIVTHNQELAERQSRSLRLQNRTLEEVDHAKKRSWASCYPTDAFRVGFSGTNIEG